MCGKRKEKMIEHHLGEGNQYIILTNCFGLGFFNKENKTLWSLSRNGNAINAEDYNKKSSLLENLVHQIVATNSKEFIDHFCERVIQNYKNKET